MKKSSTHLLLGAIGLTVAAATLATRGPFGSTGAIEGRTVLPTTATVGPIRDVIVVKGSVAYDHQLTLRLPGGGRVAPFALKEGSAVRRGQELLRVVDPQDDIELSLRKLEQRRAEAKLTALDKEMATLTRLVEIGSSAAWDLEQKKIEQDLAGKDVERAGIELRRLAAKLALGSLRSPFDGMVIAVPVVTGQLVNANEEVLTVAGGNRPFVVAYLDAMDVGRITIGQDVVFSDRDDGERRRKGKVRAIAAAIATTQRQNTVKIIIEPLAPIDDLRLAQQLYVEFVLLELAGALRVPRELVYTNGGQKLINVLDGHGLRAVPIQTTPGDATFDVVVSGITTGDQLLPSNALPGTLR